MSAKLEIEIRPKIALTNETQAIQRLYARAAYTHEVPNPELDRSGKPGKPLKVPTATTGELATNGTATLIADDGVAESIVAISIETAQGAELARTEAKFPADTKSARFVFEVAVETYRSVEPSTPAETPLLKRAGRFTRFEEELPDFTRFRFYAAPVRPKDLPDGRTNPQTAAVRKLLGLDGDGDIDDFEVTQLVSAKANPAAANAIGLRDCTLRSDGTFQFSYEIEGDEIGWFWILLGPDGYAGFQADPASAAARQVVIILPPTRREGDDPGAGGAGAGGHGGSENTDCVKCSSVPPMDFDEAQALQNPLEFGDDPGTTCAPFTNPNRVLGERPFFTVLRVDQPEIGSEGSVRVSRPIVLDLAPPLRASALAGSFAHEIDTAASNVSTAAANVAARLSRTARASVSTDVSTFATSEARSVLEAVSKPGSAYWKNWVLTRNNQRAPVTPRNPIEWEGDPAIYQAGSVAGGHMLEYRVQWRSNGYSLGKIAHTLTLAPRQTRRISKISWRRRETASRRERTAQRDQVEQSTLSSRDYSDAVQSSLSEWSNGGSESQTTGVAGGIGFALGPVVIGGGAAHGRASSESWQSGGRRVSASEQQSLRDAIRQYGDSLRRLESTVVTEVSQEEDVEGISETVRNVNYCHALTVVYHEILRHYRVDTGFAGARECLFVPFSVTPFDVHKALKWRDKLRRGMLARELRWALDRLDEVATVWVDSDIPPGRRSTHPINYVAGSAYFKLSIERPRDRAAEEAIENYRQMWAPWAPLLGSSLSQILQQLERTDRDREAYFQKEVAPGMAARWANRLSVSIGGNVLEGADFTLATSYRFGNTVRVDFTIPINKRFNRQSFQDLKFSSEDSLPVGSVANLAYATFHYFTDHFDATSESVRTTNDLILPDTGMPDPLGAITHFELTAWEQQDLRRVIEDAVDQLIVHLNANLVYYHKVIWWLMDRDELFMLLDGFTAPYGRRFENGKWVEDTGRSLASVVEREPMCILGNSLVFRVASGVFLGIDGHESPEKLYSYYFDANFRPLPLRVSLPTDGLYAQALMDSCNACEEHKGGTDWVLSDKDPELESLVGLLGSRRAAPEGLTPSAMPETLINLQNAPAAPDPTGLAGILQAVTNSGSFRDMAGLAGTQANAMGGLTQAASLAQGFGQMAVDFQKAKQGTTDAKEKLSNIEKAKSTGLIDSAEAQRQSSKVLDSQNMNAPPGPLTTEEPLSNALGRAGVSGQPIEVSRQTQYGNETVKVGQPPTSPDLQLASFVVDSPSKDTTKLPSKVGNAAAQAWEGLAPIVPRNAAACPAGTKNLGTLLCVHDAETEIDLRDYGGYTNANAWILVHTVSDLIEAIRSHVGTCNLISGVHIEAHGGWSGSGGFRMGNDTNGNGHIESGEAQDFVSTQSHAAKFGAIIKNALAPNAFISVAACGSAGNNNDFIKALQAATGAIVIGTPSGCRSGGSWFSGAWWECDKGRVQINKNGTTKVDASDDGTGIWKPF
jgi:hypothetical protein